MTKLLVDVNSIAEAAANGLPFCGTEEINERAGAVFHLISTVVTEYSPDKLFMLTQDERGLGGYIDELAEKNGCFYALCDQAYDIIRYMTQKSDTDDLVLTADDRFCAFASVKTKILLIEFTPDGSRVREVTESLSPDYLALRELTGAGTAEALLEQYGSLDALLSDEKLNFFGKEKDIRENSEILKGERDSLMSGPSALDRDQADTIAGSAKADIAGRTFTIKAGSQASDVDTSGIAFFTEIDEAVIEEFTKEAEKRLSSGEKIVFFDLKALLHSLGKAAGFPSEIRKDLTHEEDNGQLSFIGQQYKKSEAAGRLYDLIMSYEKKAWEESLSGQVSYGKALHKYFDDVKIEGYIVNPLEETECKNASEVAEAHGHFSKEMQESGQEKLYEELELPLIFVLYDMEKTGIYMEADRLQDYGKELQVHIDELEKKIYAEAGEEFNINSPKQLGEILFEKLGLPKGKKTKTGYSTSQKVLDELAPDYPIVDDVLSYRKYAKLKSTYADGLFTCVSEDGRVHTTYQQTVTATGRLSSTDPNLQNIPIRLELGKQIRKVFLPKKDSLFLDADYSQIELRVLAHMSGDENLIEAYKADKDIHTATAAAVFHVPADQVTPLQRRSAKAVNFGIVYGISSFGLGQNLSISRKEAQQYINDYFKAYPGLHSFLDGLVDSAKIKGYAETMYGRRRPVPELKESQYMRRQFGERVAMNAPIQGSAADIIKIAMLHVFERLRKEGLKSKLLLQVHDELLIEAPESEKAEAEKILKEEMENAAALKVPLEVDLEEGYDWYSAH